MYMSQTGSGTTDYLTQRTVLAKDSPGVVGLATANVALSSIFDEVESQDITIASLYVTQGSIYDEAKSQNVSLGSIVTETESIDIALGTFQITQASILSELEPLDITLSSIYDESQSIYTALGSIDIALGSILAAVEVAAAPSIYNITMATADKEYLQALPSNTKQFEFRCRGDYDVRFAYETLKVGTPTAPYRTLEAKQTKFQQQLNTEATLYIACSTDSQIVELEVWV